MHFIKIRLRWLLLYFEEKNNGSRSRPAPRARARPSIREQIWFCKEEMCFPMHRFYNFKNYIRKRKSHRLVNYIKRTHVMSNESTVNSHKKNHNGQFSASLRDGRCFCASKSRSASSRFQGSHARFQEFRHYLRVRGTGRRGYPIPNFSIHMVSCAAPGLYVYSTLRASGGNGCTAMPGR